MEQVVHSNLDSAVENGHDFTDWTDEDVAEDLINYAEDCEDATKEQLIPHIKTWRALTEAKPKT